ncbi:MAG: hypothetical protein MJ245_00005 [Clostridia bacterium]|nr:hypothetical protein [Clostridia bacterium]
MTTLMETKEGLEQSLIEKRALSVLAIDTINEKTKIQDYKDEINKRIVESDILKIRVNVLGFTLSLYKSLLKDNGDYKFLDFSKNMYEKIKSEMNTSFSHTYKGAIIYPDALEKCNNNDYINCYLSKLFLDVRNFEVASFISVSGNFMFTLHYEFGRTIALIRSNDEKKIFVDENDSLLFNNRFIKEVSNYIKECDVNDELMMRIVNALMTHGAMLKKISRLKLSILLDYQNELSDYEDVHLVSAKLRSSEPFEYWNHTLYEMIRDMKYLSFDNKDNDIVSKYVKYYFVNLGLLR